MKLLLRGTHCIQKLWRIFMRKLFYLLGVLVILFRCNFQKSEAPKETLETQSCFSAIDTTYKSQCGGCAGGFVYKNIGQRKYLIVSIDGDSVEMSTTCLTHALGAGKTGINAWVEIFEGDSVYATNYCTDLFIVNLAKPRTYTAIGGRIIYSMDSLLNVRVEDLILVNTLKADTINVKSEIFYQVDVSDYPG
jgi:hypothetical protein